MEGRAYLPGVHKKLGDRIDAHVGDTGNRPHARPFAKHVEDLNAGLEGQFIHSEYYT